jgi:hypothetical protein
VLFQHRHHVLLRLARDRRQRFHLVSPLHRSRHKKMTPSTASSETRALALSRSVTLLERPTWCISRLDARAISRRRESKRSTGRESGCRRPSGIAEVSGGFPIGSRVAHFSVTARRFSVFPPSELSLDRRFGRLSRANAIGRPPNPTATTDG